MITPIEEATHDQVEHGHILYLNKRNHWFVGRTVREGWSNKGFKFFSLVEDNCQVRSFTDKYHAIRELRRLPDGVIYVCDNLIEMCDL